MKLKLDENLGQRGRDLLVAAGHDVSTVAAERLESVSDVQLIEVCSHAERALVTLDLDFANPLRFKPSDYAGIAVLRLARKPSAEDIQYLVRVLVRALAQDHIRGRLWIVEHSRIRIYQEES